MAYDYANDTRWGSAYKTALLNGDTTYANSLIAKMNADPRPYNAAEAAQKAQQVGMILAKTSDMGRGTNVFANGGNGLEYNTVGQSRTPGQGSFNTISGQHGYAVNPGAVQGSPVGGALDPTPTMTRDQYGLLNDRTYVPYGGTTPVTPVNIDEWNRNHPSTGGGTPTPTTGVGGGAGGGTPIPTTGGTGAPTSTGWPPPTTTSTNGPGSVTSSSVTNYSTPSGLANVTNWNVDPNQTVAGQFNGLIKENSPLIQQARTEALKQANDRGLINSSLALGASDLAAYNAALPIAQADAATYASAGKTNAGEANQTARTNANAYNTLQTANLSADTQKALAAMSQDTQLKVAQMNKEYQQTLQGSQQASTLYQQAMDQLMRVYQNADWDEASKQNVMANIIDGLAGGLQLIKSIDGIDLTGWLDFTGQS